MTNDIIYKVECKYLDYEKGCSSRCWSIHGDIVSRCRKGIVSLNWVQYIKYGKRLEYVLNR